MSHEASTRIDMPFTVVDVRNALWKISLINCQNRMVILHYFSKELGFGRLPVSLLSLHIFNENLDTSYVNNTLITLIPKIDNLTLVSWFRPISLYNVIYKIVAKCLSIRMKPVMAEVISES